MKDFKKTDETSWGKVADWYDRYLADDDTYQGQVILPNLLRLMAPGPKDNILDLACGSGFFAQEFAKTGAQVIGTDISPELIALAKKHVGDNKSVTFKVSPASKLAIADGKITKVVSVLAIQNIAEVKETLAEVKRVLKPADGSGRPGGSLYLVLNHPAFRIPKASSWGWDEDTKTQYRRVDKYLSESKVGIEMHPSVRRSSAEATQTISFHRPLQYYFKLLGAAGFGVVRLEEWISHRESEAGKRSEAENRARHEFPLFLFLEARLL